jgi:hypothetical protein
VGNTEYYTRAPRADEHVPDGWRQWLIVEAVVVRIVDTAATPTDAGHEPSGYQVVVQRRLAGPKTVADIFVLERIGTCMFMDVPIGSRLVMGVVHPDAPNPSTDAVWRIVGDRVEPTSQTDFLDGDPVPFRRTSLERMLRDRLGLPDTATVSLATPDAPGQDRTWLLAVTCVSSVAWFARRSWVATSATMHT